MHHCLRQCLCSLHRVESALHWLAVCWGSSAVFIACTHAHTQTHTHMYIHTHTHIYTHTHTQKSMMKLIVKNADTTNVIDALMKIMTSVCPLCTLDILTYDILPWSAFLGQIVCVPVKQWSEVWRSGFTVKFGVSGIYICMLVGNNNGNTEGTGIMFLTDISVGDWFYSWEFVATVVNIWLIVCVCRGVRPFGVSLLMAGWDDDEGKPYLYQCDPSVSVCVCTHARLFFVIVTALSDGSLLF